ncbi:MAG: carbohydrate binding domain-containing protein [Candidatus Omnitrophica bacterium]|nr:carbohydrate binding domain-containing protein [Candidatus Omnitrophota bacterium]MDD5310896.1 carbohydrate binding domain-containing protein [Candidatus Omnitrophota bacterium]MDD5546391.1 carbohydrate binding domain-containing protein [Candidatus Omnitrophota bacterium]
MRRVLFVLGILFLSAICLPACGQKKAAAPERTEVTPVPAPAPAPAVEAPKAKAKPEIKEIILADFNTGEKPNNFGGNFGAWNKDPDDTTQGCKESFTSDERYGKKGFSLQLDYDVDSPNPAFNGFWMKLDNFDATPYNKLVFYVKGDATIGYPPRFKIELKNANGEVGKYYVTQISPTWAPVEVPFRSFGGIKDFSKLTEFTVVFEDSASRPKTGRIYMDNIGFAKD